MFTNSSSSSQWQVGQVVIFFFMKYIFCFNSTNLVCYRVVVVCTILKSIFQIVVSPPYKNWQLCAVLLLLLGVIYAIYCSSHRVASTIPYFTSLSPPELSIFVKTLHTTCFSFFFIPEKYFALKNYILIVKKCCKIFFRHFPSGASQRLVRRCICERNIFLLQLL